VTATPDGFEKRGDGVLNWPRSSIGASVIAYGVEGDDPSRVQLQGRRISAGGPGGSGAVIVGHPEERGMLPRTILGFVQQCPERVDRPRRERMGTLCQRALWKDGRHVPTEKGATG